MKGQTPSIQWKKHIPLLGVLLLLFSAGPYINRPPWFDESLTLDWLIFPLHEIPFQYVIPNNHIFYTLCLSLWDSLLNLFGFAQIHFLRVLSLIFGCCAVWIIARRINRVVGMYASLPVMILFAASGSMILFSTALRGYMAALLFTFAAFLTAEAWMKQRKFRSLFFYFCFCYFAVLTIPTNLLSIGAGLLFLLPLGLRSKKDFFRLVQLGLIALAAMLAAYLPILQKFLKVSQIREGWFSYSDFVWNYYGALIFSFLPLLIFCVIGLFRMPLKRLLKWRFLCFAGVFLTPLIAGCLFQAAPFPRVFFPLAGFFALIFSYLLSGFLRRRKGVVQKLPLLFSIVWILITPHLISSASEKLFGTHYRDDLLHPYPMSQSFRPHKVSRILADSYVQGGMQTVYIDFDADPPSLVVQLRNLDFPPEALLRDHPRFGPVQELPQGTWIICRDQQGFERLRTRFSLTGNYHIHPDTVDQYQKIYVPD
ncbi:MAG: hypothetical protein E7040_04465 [Lentisphaerae bacterium]|nr:hypothetical protein [Lentisphaerota bacterium]